MLFGLTLSAGAVALVSPTILAPPAPSPALAQAQPTATVFAIQTPPPVPGLLAPRESKRGKNKGAETAAPVPAAATPAAPVNAGDSLTTDSSGSLSTSLGGSDIAVTSEGGSYEIDAPKRRAKRAPRPAPQP